MTQQYQTAGIRSLEGLGRAFARTKHPVILLEGTRRLPEFDIPLLHQLGQLLAKLFPNVLFRSGNAEGSDTVFAEAVAAIDPARIEHVLPFSGMGMSRRHPDSPSYALEQLPKVAGGRLAEYTVQASPGTRRLVDAHCGILKSPHLAAKASYLIRDTLKVVGADEAGLAPATAGIFYVSDDDPLSALSDPFDRHRTGGTWHTIRVCVQHGVPVVLQHIWKGWIKDMG